MFLLIRTILFDWSMVALAVVASSVLLGQLEGVCEGTVLAAFGVCLVIRVLGNLEEQFRAGRRR